ncbi:hypothetical protein GCM10022214_41480 [Actinomadura miaoliensis]|uniref:Uncharacterized protein n=1 Tax=Actinomadura miaoliensis TaxID=430685 RepID=A0ABP7W184_9ACTN
MNARNLQEMADEFADKARELTQRAEELSEEAAAYRKSADDLTERARGLRELARRLQAEETLNAQLVYVPHAGMAYHDADDPCGPGRVPGRLMTRGEARKLKRHPCGNCRRHE